MILTETHSKAAEFTSPWFTRARCSHTDNYTWCRTLDPTGSYIGFFPNVCNVEIMVGIPVSVTLRTEATH